MHQNAAGMKLVVYVYLSMIVLGVQVSVREKERGGEKERAVV